MPNSEPSTLFDKLWSAHEIVRQPNGDALLWIDRLYLHEGSFHAFEQLARRAAAIDPQSPFIADTLGMILLSRKEIVEAVEVLKGAAQFQPRNPMPRVAM